MVMGKTVASPNSSYEVEESSNENQEFLSTLPRVKLSDTTSFVQYQGFWVRPSLVHKIIFLQKCFQARDTDIILTSFPKSGTTWLKALIFTIMSRSTHALVESPLLTSNPHELVLYLDAIYMENQSSIDEFSSPRILSTHLPYASLPHSIVSCNSRIVYICRNPLDQFLSYWHFLSAFDEDLNQGQTKEFPPIEKALEMACQGVQGYGPIWEHVLGFWTASLKEPNKILFLKYENLKKDINFHIKKLANFLGCPFSMDEESHGVIEEISKLCSFDNLKNLEVNKSGKLPVGLRLPKSAYFRTGKVGDSRNYLPAFMSEHLEKLIEDKLNGSGLTFKE